MNEWRRPLKLHELIDELENPDRMPVPPDGIILFPPEDANEVVTDEDSGDEDLVSLNNLPGNQLRNNVEIILETVTPELNYDSEDEIPLSLMSSNNTKNKSTSQTKKLKTFSWVHEDLEQSCFPPWYPMLGPKQQCTPLELFGYFFDDEVYNLIVTCTNDYATQKNYAGDISEDEIKCFVGILLLNGYNDLPRRYLYWENSDDCRNALVQAAMSRDRFTYIMKNIHCCDNNNLTQNDKFSKMRPVFNLLNEKFLRFAPFEEHHSVDEAMIPYFGRHGSKQFIRGKPIRWGYKFWVGSTRLGYILWFEPYQGSKTPLCDTYKDIGLGASVILQYTEKLSGMWPNVPFHIYFDNFFTSISLLHELRERGFKGTGTVRENRTGKCPLLPAAEIKKKERGTYSYMLEKEKGVFVCNWNDNSVVNIASNYLSVNPMNRAKRYSQKKKCHVYIDQPDIIRKYNLNMGGVDRSDENIGLYRVGIRGKKWYFPLFCHCIDMAQQNAWQLHRSFGGKMDNLSFRRAICTNLLETYKKTTKRGPARVPANYHAFSRYDRIDHIIVYQDTQQRCSYCHKKAQFRCEKCNIILHPKTCFKNYHTP